MDKNIFEFRIDNVVIPENENKSLFSSHLENLINLFPIDETINRYINIRKKLF